MADGLTRSRTAASSSGTWARAAAIPASGSRLASATEARTELSRRTPEPASAAHRPKPLEAKVVNGLGLAIARPAYLASRTAAPSSGRRPAASRASRRSRSSYRSALA